MNLPSIVLGRTTLLIEPSVNLENQMKGILIRKECLDIFADAKKGGSVG